MRDVVVFLMGGVAFGIAGYMIRDFQIYMADELKMRRTMRDINNRVDREAKQ
jgi:hypothetical protein